MIQNNTRHSQSGSELSEHSVLGADLLFNEDYLKRHGNKSLYNMQDNQDCSSVKSLPLSHVSKASRHSRHSLHSHKSHKSQTSKKSSQAYGLPKKSDYFNFDESSESESPSEILKDMERRKNNRKSKQDDAMSISSRSSSSSSSSSFSRESRDSKGSRASSKSQGSSSIIVPKKKKLSGEEIIQRKQELLFEIDRFEMKGRPYFRKLTLASSLEEIEAAYDRLQLDMELDDAIRSFRRLLISLVTIVEKVSGNYFVQKYSPIKPRLSGWSQSINAEIESYDNVFKKLYIKHRSKTLVGPELHLFFMITMSGITFHITSLAADRFPGLNEILKNDPSLFPKFMNFINQGANNFSNGSNMHQSAHSNPVSGLGQNQSASPPPPPPQNQGGFSIPDILKMGMDLFGGIMKPQVNPTPMQTQQNQYQTPSSMPMPNNVSTRSAKTEMPMPMPMPSSSLRPQMRGPSNVEDILKSIQEDRLETVSNMSETGFSEIPDDVSISGVVSRKPSRVIKMQK